MPQSSVEKALKQLGIKELIPEVDNQYKVDIKGCVKEVIEKYNFDEVDTTSGDKAWRLKLNPPWELKIYLVGSAYKAAVGYLAESWEHKKDAISYYGGFNPNGGNAEKYGGFTIYDQESLNLLKRLKEEGLFTGKEWDPWFNKLK